MIQLRPYQESDAAGIKRIVNQAFGIDRYAPTARLLDSALEVYLRECLIASTYARVAVQCGEVVGVIMGRVPGQPGVAGRLRNRLRVWGHVTWLALTGGKHLSTLAQHFKFGKAYARLRKAARVPLTDELTLFAVDAATRGKGAGTQLYEDYLMYLRAHGREHYFLYTDSDCTFQFYERRGMVRAASLDISLTFAGKPQTLGVYLYAGKVIDSGKVERPT